MACQVRLSRAVGNILQSNLGENGNHQATKLVILEAGEKQAFRTFKVQGL